MAEIDGAWNMLAATPMGEQRFTMTVSRQGDRFTAQASGAIGSMDIADGRIDGDTLAWSMQIAKPMPLKLTGKATVTGDRIEGGITAGFLGTYPLEGTRA